MLLVYYLVRWSLLPFLKSFLFWQKEYFPLKRLQVKRVHGSTANFHYKWLFKIALIIISYRIERKNLIKFFNFFEISKNIISKFSGRALIGQNDSLDVLLLDEFFLWFKTLIVFALSKLFTDFCLSLPALGVESLQPYCCCFIQALNYSVKVSKPWSNRSN